MAIDLVRRIGIFCGRQNFVDYGLQEFAYLIFAGGRFAEFDFLDLVAQEVGLCDFCNVRAQFGCGTQTHKLVDGACGQFPMRVEFCVVAECEQVNLTLFGDGVYRDDAGIALVIAGFLAMPERFVRVRLDDFDDGLARILRIHSGCGEFCILFFCLVEVAHSSIVCHEVNGVLAKRVICRL